MVFALFSFLCGAAMTDNADLWLVEQLSGNAFKPLSEPMPYKPMTVAEMRELLKRPPVYEVTIVPSPGSDWL